MGPSSEDIKDLLETAGLGLTHATNLFVGREPTLPDDCTTIFDTPGFGPMKTLDGANNVFHSSIQIRVRNRSYLVGYQLLKDIVVFLHGLGPETLNGTTYCSIACSTDPALLDWDETGRVRFVSNFNLMRRVS